MLRIGQIGGGWRIQLLDMTQLIARGDRSPADMARLHGVEEARLVQMVERLKVSLSRAAQPGAKSTKDTADGRAELAAADDIKPLLGNFLTTMKASAAENPKAAISELEFLLACYDRRDRDFCTVNAKDMRRLSALFDRSGLAAGSVLVNVRVIDPESVHPTLPAWATREDLGAYAFSDVEPVRVRSAERRQHS